MLTQHQHGKFIQNFEILKQKVKPKLNKNEKIINASQSSSDTRHSNPKSCLIRRQQTVHSGQLSLQLKNLTVQAADLREDWVLLGPILQHDVVTLQTPHIGLQLLDASLDVHLSVLKPRLLQQRLLVFQVPTLPIPPVTNKDNISNLQNTKPRENTTNLPTKINLYNTKILPQTSSRQKNWQ